MELIKKKKKKEKSLLAQIKGREKEVEHWAIVRKKREKDRERKKRFGVFCLKIKRPNFVSFGSNFM